jgi:hypothetical protein
VVLRAGGGNHQRRTAHFDGLCRDLVRQIHIAERHVKRREHARVRTAEIHHCPVVSPGHATRYHRIRLEITHRKRSEPGSGEDQLAGDAEMIDCFRSFRFLERTQRGETLAQRDLSLVACQVFRISVATACLFDELRDPVVPRPGQSGQRLFERLFNPGFKPAWRLEQVGVRIVNDSILNVRHCSLPILCRIRLSFSRRLVNPGTHHPSHVNR